MQRLIKNRTIFFLLALAWTILIFIGCSLPGKDLPAISIFDHFDKVVHFIFFLVFAFLWLMAFRFLMIRARTMFVVIILLSFAYGFCLEYYQIYFVQGRTWDKWDGIADGMGGIAGTFFYHHFKRKFLINNQAEGLHLHNK